MNMDRFSQHRNTALDAVDNERRERIAADRADHQRDSNPQPVKVKPVRLQLSRRKGYKLQRQSLSVNGLKAIKCTRPGKYGNPFRVGDPRAGNYTLDESLNLFEHYAKNRARKEPDWLVPLRGCNLACFCKIGEPCHCDFLLKIANK